MSDDTDIDITGLTGVPRSELARGYLRARQQIDSMRETINDLLAAQSPPAPAPSDAASDEVFKTALNDWGFAINSYRDACIRHPNGPSAAVHDAGLECEHMYGHVVALFQKARRPAAPSPAFAELLRAAVNYRTMVRPSHPEHCECQQAADELDAAIEAVDAAAKAQGAQ